MASREWLLARAFVDVSDTLVDDFDVADFLGVLAGRCVELLGVSEAGLMLADRRDVLRVAASSSHAMSLLELFEIQHDDGPCVDCYRTKAPIREDDLRHAVSRWPRFAPEAIAAGFRSVYALPMRLRHQVIGSLNLLRAEPGKLDDDELLVAQALADVATIGILQHRAAIDSRLIAEQLQSALDSRTVIEQAKGVLGARTGLDMHEAFVVMRQYALNNNQKLSDVARAIADRSLNATIVAQRGAQRTRKGRKRAGFAAGDGIGNQDQRVIELERRRLNASMGYPVCGEVVGRDEDGTPLLCRMGRKHQGPHL